MASDEHHRPCLPLKPQEKTFDLYRIMLFNTILFALGNNNSTYKCCEMVF